MNFKKLTLVLIVFILLFAGGHSKQLIPVRAQDSNLYLIGDLEWSPDGND